MDIKVKDCKPNSNRYKEQETKKKMPKVVNGKVKTKKKSEISKIKSAIFAEDINNVKDYLLNGVIIPSIKKALHEIISNGSDMLIYGETKPNKKSSAPYVSYRDYSDETRSRSRERTSSFDLDEIVFDTEKDGEAVLNELYAALKRFGIVSVADLYDLIDMSAPYTANKYGWNHFRGAEVLRGRDGYFLKLPKPRLID